MKPVGLVLAPVILLAVLAVPAGALSCIQPDPIDWETRFPRLDTALIIEVTAAKDVRGESIYGQQIRVIGGVIQVLKGRAASTIEYTVPSLDPWGPSYQPGDVIAVVIENGVVSDGRQEICGPWYDADELRRAAERYGDGDVEQPPEVPKSSPLEPEPKPEPPQSAPASEPRPDFFAWLIWIVLRLIGLGLIAN